MRTTLTAAEIGARGKAIYDASIRSKVENAENLGKFVTIDIDSGDYVLDGDAEAARSELVSRRPNAVVYLMKVGYAATAVIGGRLLPSTEGRNY